MKKYRNIYCMLLLGFLLGIHNGNVALWKTDDPKPLRVFPYAASSLPEADRKLLEKGIPIDSLGELTRLIEDYFS
ncbi:MAG: hypothetical protein J6Q53_07540 [Oscillospiraceae bacterium]|nr:hypothetical protein [Oscillospiraceae bacterium]